jgi:hypothetical protein
LGSHSASHQVAGCHHADPWNQRIDRKPFDGAAELQQGRLVQEVPDRRGRAKSICLDGVKQIVDGDHDERDRRHRSSWQEDQRGKRNHRRADGKDNLAEHVAEIETERPRKADER